MQATEYRGYWWIPGKPEAQVPGTLRFTPGQRPTLSLIGSFTPLEHFGQLQDLPLIHGAAATGEAITLYGCSESNTVIAGFACSDYQARYLLVGRHFERAEDIMFPAMEVQFTHLAEWIGRRPFAKTIGPAARWYQARWEPLDDLTVRVGDVEITLTHGYTTSGDNYSEHAIHNLALLRVVVPQPLSLDDFLNGPLQTLQYFISLGAGVPVFPTRLDALVVLPSSRESTVQVFLNIGLPSTEKLTDTLFRLVELGDDFGSALTNWFAFRAAHSDVLDLYFSVFFGGRTTYLNHQFLALAQALESYHRETYRSTLLSRLDFRTLLAALRAAVPCAFSPEVRGKIMGKFNFLNEITLAERLERLLDDASPTVLARAIPDREAFAASVRHTRNYYTHYDPKLRKKAAIGEDLVNLTDRMGWLLTGFLLKHLGLPQHRVESFLQRSQRLQHAGTWRLV